MHIHSHYDEDDHCEGAGRVYAVISHLDVPNSRLERIENQKKEVHYTGRRIIENQNIAGVMLKYLEKLHLRLNKRTYMETIELEPEVEGGEKIKKEVKREIYHTVYTTIVVYKESQENALVMHGSKPIDKLIKDLFDAFNMFPEWDKKVLVEITMCYGNPTTNFLDEIGREVQQRLTESRLKKRKEKLMPIYLQTDMFGYEEV